MSMGEHAYWILGLGGVGIAAGLLVYEKLRMQLVKN